VLVPLPMGESKPLASGLEHRPFSEGEIKQAFGTFDLDRNGFVGAAEIQHILSLVGEEVTDEEIDEMIGMCDTDGDGQVTFDEFYKLMTEPEPPRPPVSLPVARASKASAANTKPPALHRYAHSRHPAGDLARNSSSSGTTHGLEMSVAAAKKASTLRAVSLETLIKRLSGGQNKIKPSQIKRLYKRFQEIDEDADGSISLQEFQQALEIEDDRVSRQLFRVFDMDGNGSVELREFIVVLSRFTNAAKSEKLKFAFMMFDEDASGHIERGELLEMLQASFVIEHFSEAELEARADEIYNFLGIPDDGTISYESFMQLARSQAGLIYPVEEPKHRDGLAAPMSLEELLDEDEVEDRKLHPP